MPKGTLNKSSSSTCPCCKVSFVSTKVNQKYCTKQCTLKMNYVLKQTKRQYTEKQYNYSIFYNYGLSLEDYEILFEKQKGLCAICFQPETTKNKTTGKIKRLSVDHCHTTGKIRGLLCKDCNFVLGHAKDSITRLENTITYLKEFNNERR